MLQGFDVINPRKILQVDEIGDVTITNDGATILAQLDIEHPAAKVLVELAQLQDQEVKDCRHLLLPTHSLTQYTHLTSYHLPSSKGGRWNNQCSYNCSGVAETCK